MNDAQEKRQQRRTFYVWELLERPQKTHHSVGRDTMTKREGKTPVLRLHHENLKKK